MSQYFMLLRMASPGAYQATAGTALASAGEALGAALQQFSKASDLTSTWTGASAKAHEQRVAKLVEATGRVIQAIAQANTIASTGGTRLQMLKAQNDAIVASATAGQYTVLPVGQVVPGPAHYAKASGPHGAALMKLFWTIARLYTGQINGTMAQTSATDAQVAATLAAVAMQFFADLLAGSDEPGSAGSATPMPPSLTTPGSRPTDPFTLPARDPSTVDDWQPQTGGTALAGAGSLAGAGALGLGGGAGGLGAAGIGGAGALGGGLSGVPAHGPVAAGLMMGPGAAGHAGAGVGAGTAAGRAGAAGASVMPMGAGAAAGQGNGDRRGTETWLQEDRDPFDPGDDAPGAVLS